MAKKKKKSAAKRVSGGKAMLNPSSEIVQYGSILLGFLAAKPINDAIDKAVGSTIDGKIVAGGQVGLGAAYMLLKKGKKNLLLTVGSGVMIGAGAKRLMGELGMGSVAGYQQVHAVGGYNQVHAVGGYGNSNGMGYPTDYVRETVGSGLMDRAA